jgi:hypothetical protein
MSRFPGGHSDRRPWAPLLIGRCTSIEEPDCQRRDVGPKEEEERIDRREPCVARSRRVAAFVFEMFEERQDKWRIEPLDRELRRLDLQPIGSEVPDRWSSHLGSRCAPSRGSSPAGGVDGLRWPAPWLLWLLASAGWSGYSAPGP